MPDAGIPHLLKTVVVSRGLPRPEGLAMTENRS